MREYALVLLVTAAVTYLLVPLVRRFAVATHAMQAPRARDVHTEPTPRLGGLAMFGGLVAGLLVASRLTTLQDPFRAAGSRTQSGLLLAGGLIVVIGFIDDKWGLGAVSKLAGQVAAAGILVWSGQALPWLPGPNGRVMSLEPDLSVTLTILIVVVTINAINFIDGLDGLASGIVAVAAIGFLVYSYSLVRNLGIPGQSLPAVSSAVLAGMCIGFLPHNFYPARIFMGDTGAMLLGLLLAYGPISSTGSLDDAVLVNYAQNHPVNRFGTFLPLLVPAAIFLIPYTDLMLAVIRRTRRAQPLMAADREHLHHRLLGIGHSYRQSVLIMWLWAALLSATVVALSLVRTHLWVLAVATVGAVLLLLPVTMPNLRPWRLIVREPRGPASSASALKAPIRSSASSASAPGASSAPIPAQVPAPSWTPSSAPSWTPSSAPASAPAQTTDPGGWPAEAGSASWPAEADRARIAPASAFAGAPVSGLGTVPGGPSPGGPPPGFESVPAPPGFGGNGSGAGPGVGVGVGRVWPDGHGGGNVPGNGNGSSGDSGQVAADFGFGGFPEEGLRPFPGDADHAVPLADPFPRAGRLPDTSPFPDAEPPSFTDAPSFTEGSPVTEDSSFTDGSPVTDGSRVTDGSTFTDEGGLKDDTGPFPTASHGEEPPGI
jgi:UDP-GlcNAc:undecaprenyl-phosphate/decaprenyl-phosphate GlcNAc-1-phosphate transferase